MQVSYKNLFIFISAANEYIYNNADLESKLILALRKFIKQAESVIGIYNDRLSDIRIEYAAVDPVSKVLLKDATGYCYTKEGQKKLRDDVAKLNEQMVEVVSVNLRQSEMPNNLTAAQKELFADFVEVIAE